MRTMSRWVPLIAAFTIAASGAALSDDSCKPIQFKAGASSGIVQGSAPPNDVVCYTMRTAAGQTADLRITGRNVIFTIVDLIDAQDSYRFTTERKTYTIVVGQLMRAVEPEPFTLAVSVQ